jgi:hypothetical protein
MPLPSAPTAHPQAHRLPPASPSRGARGQASTPLSSPASRLPSILLLSSIPGAPRHSLSLLRPPSDLSNRRLLRRGAAQRRIRAKLLTRQWHDMLAHSRAWSPPSCAPRPAAAYRLTESLACSGANPSDSVTTKVRAFGGQHHGAKMARSSISFVPRL